MPDKKIIDLERLEQFRKLYDERLKNGSLVVSKSLTAKQLEPISDEVGSMQTNPFLFQGTGTNDNTTSTPTSPIAKHLELRGNTVKWNQLTQHFIDGTFYGVNVSHSGQSITLQGTVNNTEGDFGDFTFKASLKGTIVGHKYLYKVSGTLPIGCSIVHNLNNWNTTTNMIGIVSCNVEFEYIYIRLRAPNGTVLNDTFSNVQIFDLTDIYGAGKEPTTYLQFIRDYPLPYYAYNAGELKSCTPSKLITTGRNQFDESTIILGQSISTVNGGTYNNENAVRSDFIKVISGQTYTIYVGGTHSSIYYNEYDINNNFIQGTGATSGTPITLSNNTYYIRFSVQGYGTSYNNDICFYITWDGSKTGYVPYVKHEYDLPSVELRSAGSAYDTITPNGVHTQKIGVIDLGTLTWESQSGRFISYNLFGQKGVSNNTQVGNILCSKYKTVSQSNSDVSIEDKTISIYIEQTPYIYIADSEYLDATSLKTALNGVYLYYELETPIVTETSSFAENIEVDDFGTMEFVPSDSTEEVIVPQGNKFFYPIDISLFIDDLYNRSKDGGDVADVGNFVTQSQLEDIGGDAENLTDEYSSSSTYALGDLVIYDNVLYKCTTAITTAEAWNSTHWTATTVNAEMVNISQAQNITGDKRIATRLYFGSASSQIGLDGDNLYLNSNNGQDMNIRGNPRPFTTGSFDLGTTNHKWRNLYLQGTAYISTIACSQYDSSLNPLNDNYRSLGYGEKRWKDLYLSGKVYVGASSNTIYEDSSQRLVLTYHGTDRIKIASANTIIANRLDPDSDNSQDIGRSTVRWKDIYLSGVLSDGTNNVKVSELGSFRTFDSISNNTLTDEMVSALKKGGIIIDGQVSSGGVTYNNPILFKAQYSGSGDMWGLCLIYSNSVEHTILAQYRIGQSNKLFGISSYNWLNLKNIQDINNIAIEQFYKKPQSSVSLSDGGTISDSTLKSLIQNEQPIKLNGFTCYFSCDDGTNYQYVSTRYDSSANKNHINVITIDKSTWVATFHTSDLALS